MNRAAACNVVSSGSLACGVVCVVRGNGAVFGVACGVQCVVCGVVCMCVAWLGVWCVVCGIGGMRVV